MTIDFCQVNRVVQVQLEPFGRTCFFSFWTTGKSSEATSPLADTYAAVGVIGKLVQALKNLLQSAIRVDAFGNLVKKNQNRPELRLPSKLLTRLAHTKCHNNVNPNPVLKQMEASLTSESGLCQRLLIESETRADCLSWINRMLRDLIQ